MEKMIRSFGRTELAQLYFPGLTPDGAWHKLRAWLHLNPRLSHFYELRRRTFTPAEVQLIYTELGELDAIEVFIFKGNKAISIKRGLVQNPAFNKLFRRLYEK